MEIQGKCAVITGAASGIGRATCEALLCAQIRSIAAVDRSGSVQEMAERANKAIGREVLVPFVGDAASDAFRQSVFREMKTRGTPVSICVPAAGITRDRLAVKLNKETGAADTYPRKDLEDVLSINLMAPILWAIDTVASVAEDRARRNLARWSPNEDITGCIVFIGSVSSAGNKGQISYAAAKAGLEGAQATLAKEAIYYGVRCNIIHPGYTDTPMVRAMGDQLIEEHILPLTQLRRLLHPDEIADAIVFMMRNSTVSGSLWVDAGWHPAA